MASGMVLPALITDPRTGRSVVAHFRIDTGADVSALDLRIISALGSSPSGRMEILDADGTPITAPTYSLLFSLQGCNLGRVEFVGLDLTRSGYDGLLGEDVLNKGILVRDGIMGRYFFFVDGNCGTCGSIFQMEAGQQSSPYLALGIIGLLLGGTGLLLLLAQRK